MHYSFMSEYLERTLDGICLYNGHLIGLGMMHPAHDKDRPSLRLTGPG